LAISSIAVNPRSYDSDRIFLVFGFGAKYEPKFVIASSEEGKEKVHGVAGVLEAYHQVFKSVFREEAEMAASRATSVQEVARKKGCRLAQFY
jgi:hypothetical protein